MMLNWLGDKRGDRRLKEAWRSIDRAVDEVLTEGKVRTPDLGGTNNTKELGTSIADAVLKIE